MSIAIKFDIRKDRFHLHVELELPARGVTALFGPSGSGKTTFLRALAGLERHPGCRLQVGKEIWQDRQTFIPPHKRHLGYVFQEAALFPHLTVRGNLAYGQKRNTGGNQTITFDKAVQWLNIQHLLDRRPDTLSGGEKQRAAIARALVVNPGLLLMDEPLASLDQEGKNNILPYLDTLRQVLDIPVVYVSHNITEVSRLADRLVLLQSGSIAASGSINDMLTRLDTPLAFGNDASSVINARVVGYDPVYQLNRLSFNEGTLTIPGNEIDKDKKVRVRLAARDVSLVLEEPSGSSIQNVFPAVVDDLVQDGALVTVRLFAGLTSILARITLKSADELDIHHGKHLFVQIKSAVLLN